MDNDYGPIIGGVIAGALALAGAVTAGVIIGALLLVASAA